MSFPKDPDLMALLREALTADLTETTLLDKDTLDPSDTVLGIVPESVRGLFIFATNLIDSEEYDELVPEACKFCNAVLQMYIPALADYEDYKICEHWEVVGVDLTETERKEESGMGHVSSYFH